MLRASSVRTMKTLGGSVIFALAWWPRSLLAQPAPTPIYVTTRLATECHAGSDFAQQLLGRTHRLRWAYPGEPGIMFDVAANAIQGGFLGQLQIRELDGRFTQRSVEGNTCDGVINALAFVAAVLVDPEAAEHTAPAALVASAPAPTVSRRLEAPKIFEWGIGVTSGVTSAAPNNLQLDVGGRVNADWESPGFCPWISVGFDARLPASTTTTLNSAQSQLVKRASAAGRLTWHLARFGGPVRVIIPCDPPHRWKLANLRQVRQSFPGKM